MLAVFLLISPASYAGFSAPVNRISGGGGGTPGGSSGQIQYNNSGSFGGIAAGSSQAAASFNLLNGKTFIDPRDPKYGTNTCTGYFPIVTSNITSGHTGTGYVVGDVVGVVDLLNSGGTLATQSVTTVSAGGVVTSLTPLTGGGGFTTGGGNATVPFSTPTVISQAITGTASNGGLIKLTVASTAGYLTGAQVFVQNVNGTVEANTVEPSNGWTVTVTDGTHLTLQGSTFTNAFIASPNATALRVGGTGLQVDITAVGTGNDDTTAFTNALVDSAATGACVLPVNGCWISATTATALTPHSTSCLGGNSPAVTYGFDQTVKPVINVIGTPTYGIVETQNAVTLRGFQLDGQYNFATNILSGVGVGSSTGNSAPAGFGAPWRFDNMSVKGFLVGNGSPTGTGSPLFEEIYNSDFAANNTGIFGPLSDAIVENTRFCCGDTGMYLPDGPGGSTRATNNRLEFLNKYAFRGETGGGAQSTFIGNQIDRTGLAAYYFNNTFQASIIGGSVQAAGLAGTLTVTGAAKCVANNDVCLHVSSNYTHIAGGSNTSLLSAGDVTVTSGVGGTTEANGTATITVVDGSHIDLQGVTFVNAYTSGGVSNVKGKDAMVQLNGTENDIDFTDVMFTGTSDGAIYPAAYIVEDTAGDALSGISFIGGAAYTGSNYQTSGYTGAFANWLGGTPTDLTILRVNGTADSLNTALTVTGAAVSGNTLVSTVATGTAPLTVASTTQVANLNAATAGTVSTISGLITQGTNITVTGGGTSGSPYNIAATGGGSGTVTSSTIGQVPVYTGATTVAGSSAFTAASGVITANSYIPTSSSIPTDGYFLLAANQSAIADRSLTAAAFTNPASAVGYWSFTGAATGVAPSVSNVTTDTNGAGLGLAFKAANATATGTGGGVAITAGNGFASGATAMGGTVTLTGGASNTASAQAFNGIDLEGGTAGNGAGGGIKFQSGNATTAAAQGGAITMTVGNSVGTQAGNTITFTAGLAGSSGNQAGGAVILKGGAGFGAGAGGAPQLTGGAAGATGVGGAITLTSGAGGATSGNSGAINLTPGTVTSGTAGVINAGNGIVSTGTKFTTSGCSVSATTGGAAAGTFTLGANSCSAVITMNGAVGATAPNGWTCQAHDRTAPTVLIGGDASSTTTTATFTIPAGAGATDVISFSCAGY